MLRHVPLALVGLLHHARAQAADQVVFAEALERCIRDHAEAAAASFPSWGDTCMPPTEKIDIQSKVYERTLVGIRDQYGYTGALWCAFYSMRMTGREYDPNDTQPNNPNFFDWYSSLLCPWNLDQCGSDRLGAFGNEWDGAPVEGAPNQNQQYLTTPADPYVPDEPDRRTMSCALCGWLKRRLGDPPFIVDPAPLPHDLEGADLYTANWDFHPFGAWLANDAFGYAHFDYERGIDALVHSINIWRASNGEEIHGFLWQSTRLLAHEGGTLAGARKAVIRDAPAVSHVLRVCKPSWWLAPQSRDDCSHAAGHGLLCVACGFDPQART
eukprot:7386024-Prymnesium_polylepis.2